MINCSKLLGRSVPVEGARQVINRHLLLNMWRPWTLLMRQRSGTINPFKLTSQGIKLAQGGGRTHLNEILKQIIFVHPNWCKPGVVSRYTGFNVSPYYLLDKILHRCSGWIDRIEYRLFIARLTNQTKTTINRATDFISSFRNFSDTQQRNLIALEKSIYGSASKVYQNWVDMDLHTFSLFSTGTTFIRDQNVLTFAGTSIAANIRNLTVAVGGTSTVPPPAVTTPVVSPTRTLNLRTPPPDPALLNPPAPAITINTGQEAETFVQELFEEAGFEVRNFSRMRGYGFDLWSKNKNTGDVFYVEVKSSTGSLGTLELTSLECQASQQYGERFLLVCVENFDATTGQGDVWIIQNPWTQIPSIRTPITTTSHRANRVDWSRVAQRF